jgi:hypothetical protein
VFHILRADKSVVIMNNDLKEAENKIIRASFKCYLNIYPQKLPQLTYYNRTCHELNCEFIQGVPGGRVSILECHIIGHYKKKVYVYMCPIANGFRDTAISLCSSKIVDKKEILRTVSNTGIYCSSDKVGTVYLA